MQVGDPLITTTWKVLMGGVQRKLEGILRPQQVAVGVQGGLSILVHGVRALMQQSPGLVCVKLDLRNAFNEVERAALVEAVYSYPELRDLVPLMVKTYAPETTAVMGRGCEALFEGERGDVSQGGPQGNPLMGAAFCLAIHPYVRRLHDRLTREGVGGAAMFDMDDGYAIGPPGEVFEAVEEFLEGLQKINLMARVDKFEVWAPQADVSGDAASLSVVFRTASDCTHTGWRVGRDQEIVEEARSHDCC